MAAFDQLWLDLKPKINKPISHKTPNHRGSFVRDARVILFRTKEKPWKTVEKKWNTVAYQLRLLYIESNFLH